CCNHSAGLSAAVSTPAAPPPTAAFCLRLTAEQPVLRCVLRASTRPRAGPRQLKGPHRSSRRGTVGGYGREGMGSATHLCLTQGRKARWLIPSRGGRADSAAEHLSRRAAG